MKEEKRKHFIINFLYFVIIVLIALFFIRFAMPLLAPFLIGFLIAYLTKKPARFLERLLHLPRKLAAIVTVILFYGIAGGLISFLGVKAFTGIKDLIEILPELYETHILPFLMEVFRNVEAFCSDKFDVDLLYTLEVVGSDMLASLGQAVSNISVVAMRWVTGFAASLPGLFIKLVLMIISSFFIAVDYDKLRNFCMRQIGRKAENVFMQIKEYVVGTLWVCIRSYALIMSITFVELSIGFHIIGLNHPFLVAFCIALFDILPVLGTGGIMIPWTVLTLIQGDFSLALGLGLIYIAVTVIRNIIEPKIVGSQLGLHPVVTLASMTVGAQLFGVIGLFGFPIGLSLLRYLDEHGVIQLFRWEEE